VARGRNPVEEPGGGGLECRGRVEGRAVDLLGTAIGLGTGVSGSSSNWDILAAAAAEYG
jgi:hypothetical protein